MIPFTGRIQTDSRNRLIIPTYIDKTVETSGRGTGKRAGASYEATIIDAAGKKRVRRLLVDGTWSLTPEHDLKFHILGSDYFPGGKTLIFRGDIKHVKGNAIVYRIREYENVLGIRSGTITLRGIWKADKYNRIKFDVIKGKGRYDTLTFQGAWNVNQSNEVIYKYRKTYLKTRKREEKILVFKGHWKLEKGRIIYQVEHSRDSYFSFKAGFRSRSLSAGDRKLRCSVGIAYLEGKTFRKVRKIIAIYGNWRLERDLKVSFVVTYSGGRREKIEFGVEKLIKNGNTIIIFLTDRKGEPLDIRIEFIKTFKNDVEFFLTLSRAGKETKVIGGVKVKF